MKKFTFETLIKISIEKGKKEKIIYENGLDLTTDIDGYCTFTNARRILGRTNQLTLQDIASECGYYLHNAHNAYSDVWATVAVYTYLKKIEEQQKGEYGI